MKRNGHTGSDDPPCYGQRFCPFRQGGRRKLLLFFCFSLDRFMSFQSFQVSRTVRRRGRA